MGWAYCSMTPASSAAAYIVATSSGEAANGFSHSLSTRIPLSYCLPLPQTTKRRQKKKGGGGYECSHVLASTDGHERVLHVQRSDGALSAKDIAGTLGRTFFQRVLKLRCQQYRGGSPRSRYRSPGPRRSQRRRHLRRRTERSRGPSRKPLRPRPCAPRLRPNNALRNEFPRAGNELSNRVCSAGKALGGVPAPRVAPQPRPAAIRQACAMSAQILPAVMNPQRRG